MVTGLPKACRRLEIAAPAWTYYDCCQCIIREGLVTGTLARFRLTGKRGHDDLDDLVSPTNSDPRSSRRSFGSACHVAARRGAKHRRLTNVKPLWQAVDESPVYVDSGH